MNKPTGDFCWVATEFPATKLSREIPSTVKEDHEAPLIADAKKNVVEPPKERKMSGKHEPSTEREPQMSTSSKHAAKNEDVDLEKDDQEEIFKRTHQISARSGKRPRKKRLLSDSSDGEQLDDESYNGLPETGTAFPFASRIEELPPLGRHVFENIIRNEEDDPGHVSDVEDNVEDVVNDLVNRVGDQARIIHFFSIFVCLFRSKN